MYERFTDRARKVMQLANQEAQRFNHEYIGTEHILLGLVKEGSGVAANVLKNLDIDLRKVRLEVEKIMCSGACRVTMGTLPLTPRAKKVIENSLEEVKKLNHMYAGTEHLLLGLVREEHGVAAQILLNLGLKFADIRKEVLQILGHEIVSEESPSGQVSVSTLERRRFRSCGDDDSASKTKGERLTESDRIRSLEQQLWNVRIVLGALAGALAGALLAASTGAVLGLIIGGGMAALGRRIPAALIAGIAGTMLGSAHLPMDGGGVAGALLGALFGFLIAEIGRPIARR